MEGEGENRESHAKLVRDLLNSVREGVMGFGVVYG